MNDDIDDYQHTQLAAGRWQAMTLAGQPGNVGSEYERALKWKTKANKEYFEKAFDRMLELLDLTISDKRWHSHGLKELTRLREAVCEEFYGQPFGDKNLQSYFLQFGILARRQAVD